MTLLTIPRWLMGHLMSRPLLWLMIGGIIGLVPVLSVVRPAGAWQDASEIGRLTAPWIGPVAVLAGLVALGALATIVDFLRYLPPTSRVLVEVACTISLALLFQALLFAGARCVAPGPFWVEVQPMVTTAVSWSVFVAALCALILRLRISVLPAALVLMLAAWVAPRMVPGELGTVLGAPISATGGPPLVATLRIGAGLVVAAWVLAHPLRAPRRAN